MRKLFLFAIVLMSVFFSCTKNDGSTLGSDFVDSHSRLILVDTVTVATSTVKYDSIATSGKNVALVGQYRDGDLGLVSSKSYMEFGMPTFSAISNNATVDSVKLILGYNKYYYGDTTAVQNIYVNRLTSYISGKIYEGSLFNVTHINSADTPLGYLQYTPRPKSRKKIQIPLDKSLGIDFLNKMRGGADEFSSASLFLQYFKGLVVYAGQNDNSAIVGFNASDTSTYIRLFYHINGTLNSDTYYDFQLTNTNEQFNQISSDRSGTALANLGNGLLHKLDAQSTNQITYAQAGVGLATRIEFPYLTEIPKLGNYGTILKATLYIKPLRSSYVHNVSLPSQLNLYSTVSNNQLESAIQNTSGNNATGNLVLDYLHKENTQYTFDITSYLKAKINASYTQNLALILMPANYYSTLDRLIIGGQKNKDVDYQIGVKIYYMVYDE
ncbi:MAG: DUF4270 family protein [Bacteroidota bacterium]|nr:DUF4270 family protein [Bacteroidota bacterium]MDP4226051.1 DUF4270 family protein [Bacteroidota bacterium]MDP4275014.1 DUF4270 family protein [Bacteroidota bacterium]